MADDPILEAIENLGVELPPLPTVTLQPDPEGWDRFRLVDGSGATVGEGLIEGIAPTAYLVWIREVLTPDDPSTWQRCAHFFVCQATPMETLIARLKMAVAYVGYDVSLEEEPDADSSE